MNENLKALYEKIEREQIKKISRRSDKKYSASDIKQSIRKIFKELNLSEVKMITMKNLLMNEEKFKEIKYQEIRSVILSKKFEYDLKMIEEISTIKRR